MTAAGSPRHAALLERARRELPEPGDPVELARELAEAGIDGPEALEVLARVALARRQLRDMALERVWQRGISWFLARNVMILALLALTSTMVLHVPLPLFEAGIVGVAIYYVLTLALLPWRVRGHRRRRATILRAYGEDLGGYLDTLDRAR